MVWLGLLSVILLILRVCVGGKGWSALWPRDDILGRIQRGGFSLVSPG